MMKNIIYPFVVPGWIGFLLVWLYSSSSSAWAAEHCDVSVRMDAVMVSSNLSAVGFPPLLTEHQNPTIFFGKTVREETLLNNSCYVCHESGRRFTSDSFRYERATGEGPLRTAWAGTLNYRSETNGRGAFECSSVRIGPNEWSEPACGFSFATPPDIVVSNRTRFSYTLVRSRTVHGLFATTHGTAVQDISEEAHYSAEMQEPLALSDFVDEAAQGLNAAPWPAWKVASRVGWAERGGRNVLTVLNEDRAEFNASLTKLKYRLAVRGPKGHKRLVNWVERFTPNGGGPVVDTSFSEEVTCTGLEQFLIAAGGEGGKIVAPPPAAGRLDVLLVGQWSCHSEHCPPGRGKVSTGSIDVTISLGKTLSGESAGFLALHADAPEPGLSSPDRLQLFIHPSVEVLRDGPHLRQLRAPQTLVMIVPSPDAYEVRFHPVSTEREPHGFYVASGRPDFVWRFESPGADPARFLVTQQSSGGNVLPSEFLWSESDRAWSLLVGDLRKETRATSEANGLRVERFTIREMDDRLVYQQVRTFRPHALLGELLLREELGDPRAPLTTIWNYYTEPADGASLGKLESVQYPNGGRESFVYDEAGRVRLHTSDFALTPNGRVLEYRYVPFDPQDDGSRETDSPRLTLERVLGYEISRRYRSVRPQETLDIECHRPGAAWDDPDNLVTSTRVSGDAMGDGFTETVARPDGTLQLLHRTSVQPGRPHFESTETGTPNSNRAGIIDGIRTEAAYDGAGRIVSRSSHDVGSGTPLALDAYTYADPFGPPTQLTHLDGTVTAFSYDCCNLVSTIARDGMLAAYTYDALGRRTSASRNGITELYSYDAADHLVSTRRQGTNGEVMLVRSAVYDLAGREIQSSDGVSNLLTRSFEVPPQGGGTLSRTRFPDGGVVVEWHAPAGAPIELSGSASHPVGYVHGVEIVDGQARLFTAERNLNFDGTATGQWSKTYYDSLGRPWAILRSDGTRREFFYNAAGQLRKQRDFDGRITLYAYNARGDLEFSALDVDGSDSIDLAGTDRITRVVTDFAGGRARTRTYVWPVVGTDETLLTRTQERSPDGRFTSLERFGARSSRRIETPGAGVRRVIETETDGIVTTTVYDQGQLRSIFRIAANGEVLERTAFTSDAHGRVESGRDERTGLVTRYQQDEAEQIIREIVSGDEEMPASVMAFSYDGRGRRTRIVFPDGSVRTNLYTLAGLPRAQFGAQAYPMQQEYDAQGHLTELTTWARSGAAKTRWEYEPRTGWPSRKSYADGASLKFTYAPGGALETFTSGQVTTTYHYDAAGLLSSLSRGNSSDEVQFLERDRLGRPHRIDSGTNSILLAYHPSGRLVSETFHRLRVTNTLDSAGRVVALQVFPTGTTTPVLAQQIQYDGASRIREIAAGPVRVTYQYLASSSLIREILYRYNGDLRMITTHTYDNRGRLLQVASASASAPALTFDYQFNALGQRIKLREADGSAWAYDYDALGQLIRGRRRWADGVTVPGQQFEYSFDDLGNRSLVRVGGDAQGGGLRVAAFTANAVNQYDSRVNPVVLELFGQAPARASVFVNEANAPRYRDYFHLPLVVERPGAADQLVNARAALLQVSRTNSGRIFLPPINEAFTYDADGNLLTDGRWRYTWDAARRLLALEAHPWLPDTARGKLAFTYDFRGRRLTKTVWDWNAETRDYQLSRQTKFVYDGWRLLAELDGSGALLRSYVWGTDLSGTPDGSAGVGGLLAMLDHQAGAAYFYAPDASGNVRALVAGVDGRVVGHYDYGPFGEPLRATGEQARQNPFRFSTRYQDDETELVYYGYRYYSPRNGRWLSRDPLGEKGGLPLYAYARNDPVNRLDAVGLRAEFPRRDLVKYRSCRRREQTTPLLQGGFGPGDYQKDCCELITVLVKLPLCTARGLDGKGLGGHSGIGINDEYYDYGPAVSVGPLTAVTGVPGSQWWDDPAFPVWNPNLVSSPDDIMLGDILGNLEDGFAREPFGPDGEAVDMFKVEVAVTPAEAGRARDYWQNKYQDLGRFTVFGDLCSTTVMHSLEHAGVYHRPFLTFSPMALLKSLRSTTHTCGPNRGQRVKLEQISWDAAVASCGNP